MSKSTKNQKMVILHTILISYRVKFYSKKTLGFFWSVNSKKKNNFQSNSSYTQLRVCPNPWAVIRNIMATRMFTTRFQTRLPLNSLVLIFSATYFGWNIPRSMVDPFTTNTPTPSSECPPLQLTVGIDVLWFPLLFSVPFPVFLSPC